MNTKESISFVIPCYNSTNTIEFVVNEITETMNVQMSEYDYEIILLTTVHRTARHFRK